MWVEYSRHMTQEGECGLTGEEGGSIVCGSDCEGELGPGLVVQTLCRPHHTSLSWGGVEGLAEVASMHRVLQLREKTLRSPATTEKVMAALSPTSSSVAITVSTLVPAVSDTHYLTKTRGVCERVTPDGLFSTTLTVYMTSLNSGALSFLSATDTVMVMASDWKVPSEACSSQCTVTGGVSGHMTDGMNSVSADMNYQNGQLVFWYPLSVQFSYCGNHTSGLIDGKEVAAPYEAKLYISI